MRRQLEKLRSEGYSVDLECVIVGFQREDDGGRLVSALEVREFLGELDTEESAAVLALTDEEEFAEALGLLALDPSRELLADRKWCCRMLRERIEVLPPDAVDALMLVEEFWVEWRYPGPYGMLGRDEWVNAEVTLDRVLQQLRRWLHTEHEAIETVENPGLHRRTIAPR